MHQALLDSSEGSALFQPAAAPAAAGQQQPQAWASTGRGGGGVGVGVRGVAGMMMQQHHQAQQALELSDDELDSEFDDRQEPVAAGSGFVIEDDDF